MPHTPEPGYRWKLCPYSDAYQALYYDNNFSGPSTHAQLKALPWTRLTVSTHSTYEGRMFYKNTGIAGHICMDDACYHYVTYGTRYFEG